MGEGFGCYDRAAIDAAIDQLQGRVPQGQVEIANPWDDLLK